MELRPTTAEVEEWILKCIRHSTHVHYYSERLGIHPSDQELPHDLAGPNNKLEWPVLKGLALSNERKEVDFKTHIKPCIELHREQYHHQLWHGDHRYENQDDLMFAAVDMLCALMENRAYHGGCMSRPAIIDACDGEIDRRSSWLMTMLGQMALIPAPNLEVIDSFYTFPNIGISQDIHEKIQHRTREGLINLQEQGYRFCRRTGMYQIYRPVPIQILSSALEKAVRPETPQGMPALRVHK